MTQCTNPYGLMGTGIYQCLDKQCPVHGDTGMYKETSWDKVEKREYDLAFDKAARANQVEEGTAQRRAGDKVAGVQAETAQRLEPTQDDPLNQRREQIERLHKLARMFGNMGIPGSGNWLTRIAERLEALEIEHRRRPALVLQELATKLRDVREHCDCEMKRISALYREVQEANEQLCKDRALQRRVIEDLRNKLALTEERLTPDYQQFQKTIYERSQEILVLKAKLAANERECQRLQGKACDDKAAIDMLSVDIRAAKSHINIMMERVTHGGAAYKAAQSACTALSKHHSS